jgi:AcrR family transcriptional regulator
MQNEVLIEANEVPNSLATRSVDRALARRRAAYTDEVRRLLDAGFASIRETGRLEPKVSDVVRAAGLSNQAFYRHFRTKDEFLLAVLDEGIWVLADYLRQRMATATSPEQGIRRWLEGLTRQALRPDAAEATRPFALERARLAELFPEEVKLSETRVTAPLREALERAARAGTLPVADPTRDAETLYDLAMGWLQRRLSEPGPVSDADVEHLVEFALGGLRHASAAERRAQ